MEDSTIINTEERQSSQERLYKHLSREGNDDTPNPLLEDGRQLRGEIRSRLSSQVRHCMPTEEIDPFYFGNGTFVVVGRWGTIHRFSSRPDGPLSLEETNAVRKVAIYVYTHWIYSAFIVATILLNTAALIVTQGHELSKNLEWKTSTWLVDTMLLVNIICINIYCIELAIKIIARGIIGAPFTAFRDLWTYLDITAIVFGFFFYTHYPGFRLCDRGPEWLRLLKLIPLLPGALYSHKLSWNMVKRLSGMIFLTSLLGWFFALLGTQMFMGVFTQKCIKEFNPSTGESWESFHANSSNWDMETELCGNGSGTVGCHPGYTCIQGFGPNPDFGATNFDNVLWSGLSVIRIASEDFTEYIVAQLYATSGPWPFYTFFNLIFFFITFCMGCLFFSTLATVFAEEDASKDLSLVELDVCIPDPTQSEDGPPPPVGFKRTLKDIVDHPVTKMVVVLVILLDVASIAAIHEAIPMVKLAYVIVMRVIPYITFVVYATEFVLKLVVSGPLYYFKDKWNIIDLLVLLTFFIEMPSYWTASYTEGYNFAPFRFLKLVRYWPRLRLICTIYWRVISSLSGWIVYTCIFIGFMVLIGPFQTCSLNLAGKVNISDPSTVPRFSFLDHWQSFKVVVRALFGEWIETLWDCYAESGSRCFPYYFAVIWIGGLLISVVLVAVVLFTLEEMSKEEVSGLSSLHSKLCDWISSKFSAIKGTCGRTCRPWWDISSGTRRKLQGWANSMPYKVGTTIVILVACVAMNFELYENNPGATRTTLLAIEIVFTICLDLMLTFEVFAFTIGKCIQNPGFIFEVFILVENLLNLSVIGFSTNPDDRFLLGFFYIRALRPFMLISRWDRLKAALNGLKHDVSRLWETALAILFLWLFFNSLALHGLNGRLKKCTDPVTEDTFPNLNMTACLAKNLTWGNTAFNFDHAGNGFVNMAFLASRMGWVQIIQDASDAAAVKNDSMERENSKSWLLYFISFLFVGALGAMGVLFSIVLKKFQEDNHCSIILSPKQQEEVLSNQPGEGEEAPGVITLEKDYIPKPQHRWLVFLYDLVTHPNFEILVIVIIIVDNVCWSMEHYHLEAKYYVFLYDMSILILLLYIAEFMVKLAAWKHHYFSNRWNWFDFFVIFTGVTSLVFEEIYFPTVFRIFRIFRIVRLVTINKLFGFDTMRIFVAGMFRVKPAFFNMVYLLFTNIWTFSLLGMYLFPHHTFDADYVFNFRTFPYAFRTLTLLLGFPGLDTIYSSLSVDENHVTAAVYLGAYVVITFLLLLNMYAVMIWGLVTEMGIPGSGQGLRNGAGKGQQAPGANLSDVAHTNGSPPPEGN